MKKNNYIKFISFVLLVFFSMTILIVPVAAQEINTDKQILTLEEIQQLAVQNSRSVTYLDLTVEQNEKQKQIIRNKLRSSQYGTSMGLYESMSELSSKKAELEQEYQSLVAQGASQDLLTALKLQINALDNQLSQVSSSRSQVYSSIDQLIDQRDSAEDTLEDLERQQEDLEKQIKHSVAKLVFQAIDLENSIDLLEKTYGLKLKLSEIERVKQELGMATDVDIEKSSAEASNYAKQLKLTKENYKVLKRQLNDFMGREPDQPLQIVHYQVQTVYPAPSYQEIIDEAKENNYDLYKYDREIKNLEEDDNEVDASNEEKIIRNNIKKAQLDKTDKILQIENNIKTILANLDEKVKAFHLAQYELQTASKNFEWQKKKFELGLLSKLQFQGEELTYQQALNARLNAAYDYYTAYNKLELARKGIFVQ